jgi:hypothetical protein
MKTRSVFVLHITMIFALVFTLAFTAFTTQSVRALETTLHQSSIAAPSGIYPIAADFNGNGYDDVAVFSPSNGTWYFRSGAASIQYGEADDIPVPADYNGDGKAEIAIFRPAEGKWYIRGLDSMSLGQQGDIPVPADYNGDGKTD